MDPGDRAGTRLPLVIPAVARRARAVGDHAAPARARARTRDGRWLVVRGSLLGDGPHAPVAVLLEPARPAEMAPLLAAAYGLTDSELRVTELVAHGRTTREIAAKLHLSAYTVQDHLKSIFVKTGTGSRGDLVATLFFDHFATALTSRS
jgi:DNA-binding CsgD family transcriptional regulator